MRLIPTKNPGIDVKPPPTPPVIPGISAATQAPRDLASVTVPRPVRLGLHPVSAVALLGIDNLCFGAEAITFGLAWPFVTAFAFLVTTFTVFVVQMWLHRDRFLMAAPKALLCGILAGFPTSIGGTVVAAFVLVWAGLAKFGRWIFKR